MNTFSFRAECLADVNHFCTLCDIAALGVDTRVLYDTYPGYPDVMVEVQTTATLEELEAVLRKVPDGHAMLQTLGVGCANKNPGIRDYTKG